MTPALAVALAVPVAKKYSSPGKMDRGDGERETEQDRQKMILARQNKTGVWIEEGERISEEMGREESEKTHNKLHNVSCGV